MIYAEDEDVTIKVPAVSPNDVIDVEVSPLIRAQASSWLKGFDKISKKLKIQTTPLSTTKDKKNKKLKSNYSITPKKQKETMQRGDPFLPSVMCEENPVVDLSSKKGTHKKPMDCKCKGMGFNCSPSAVLPEEMRQQWGYGMFGKNASSGSSCADNSDVTVASRPSVPNSHPSENVTNRAFSSKFRYGTSTGHSNSPRYKSNTCTPVRFCECKKDLCSCVIPKTKQDAYPFSEATEKKRQKLTNKNNGYKIKGSKTQILISAKNNLQTMKTIACINNKENTNIISTSNFNKNNHSSSSFSSFRQDLENGRPSLKRSNTRLINSSGGNSSAQGNGIDCSYVRNKIFPSSPQSIPEDPDVSPCPRYRHRMKATKRSFLNIRQPPTLSTRDNPVRFYEPRKCLPRITTQNYISGSQMCSCDRCRRKALLLSKMEALGFPSSSAQMNPSPYSFPVSHRYYASSMSSSHHSSNPYTSSAPMSHTYTSSPGIYCPPTSYDRSSPSFESDLYVSKNDIFSSSSMPLISRGVNTEASSYVDTEASLESPASYTGIIEDITDLSIKDTVEFFMTLRSPFADPREDTSSDLHPGVSSEDEAFNCCIGSCACSAKQHSFIHNLTNSETMNVDKLPVPVPVPVPSTPPRQLKIHNYSDSCPTDAPTQSMSLLYSSLMSNLGLEDELRCAIENIPME